MGAARAPAASEELIADSKEVDAYQVVNDEITSFRQRQKIWLTLVGEVAVEYESEREAIYRGQLDHCVAIEATELQSQERSPEVPPGEVIRRGGLKKPLLSILAVVEAKHDGTMGEAGAQLLGYLAILHESRKRKKRANTSVVGIATAGLSWVVYKINHKGTVSHQLSPVDLVVRFLNLSGIGHVFKFIRYSKRKRSRKPYPGAGVPLSRKCEVLDASKFSSRTYP
ncbi:hypothetical protein ABW21_db0204089 [Orbilia brochopaga]|nr:hypothetical protein ABW21_db0204089 [Drechslerella brochopaga]